jgi:hypothetical protein
MHGRGYVRALSLSTHAHWMHAELIHACALDACRHRARGACGIAGYKMYAGPTRGQTNLPHRPASVAQNQFSTRAQARLPAIFFCGSRWWGPQSAIHAAAVVSVSFSFHFCTSKILYIYRYIILVNIHYFLKNGHAHKFSDMKTAFA